MRKERWTKHREASRDASRRGEWPTLSHINMTGGVRAEDQRVPQRLGRYASRVEESSDVARGLKRYKQPEADAKKSPTYAKA